MKYPWISLFYRGRNEYMFIGGEIFEMAAIIQPWVQTLADTHTN